MTEDSRTLIFQGLRDPEAQALVLKEHFPHLKFDKNLIHDLQLPSGAEEFLLVPDPLKLWSDCTDYDYYPGSVDRIMDILRKEQNKRLCMSSSYMLDTDDLERCKEILAFYQKLRKTQPGDIFMIPVKIFAYAEMSAQTAITAIENSETREIGFGAYENLIAYLTHIAYPPFHNCTVRANCLGDTVTGRNHMAGFIPSITFRKRDFGLKNREGKAYDKTMVNFVIVEMDMQDTEGGVSE